jgi:hypothetical protein
MSSTNSKRVLLLVVGVALAPFALTLFAFFGGIVLGYVRHSRPEPREANIEWVRCTPDSTLPECTRLRARPAGTAHEVDGSHRSPNKRADQ